MASPPGPSAPNPSVRWADYQLHVLLVALVFVACAYFYNGFGWNQTARYDAIWAFVEPGPNQFTVRIDDFVTNPAAGFNTGDWARNPSHSPHYYSNKAPGTTLLGIPFYFALYHVETLVGVDPQSVRSVLVNAYLIHLWVTVLPVAISAAFFLSMAVVLTERRSRALLLALILYGCTLMLPFSTMLWGHTTAAAFAVMSLACFVTPGRRRAFWSGLLIGVAVLTDYGAAPLAVILLVAMVASRSRRGDALAFVLGGLGPALVFATYHQLVFGSFMSLASSFSNPVMVQQEDVGGLFQGLRLDIAWDLTLAPTRGLFFYMPVLLLTVAAALRMRHARRPDVMWVLLACVVVLFLLNVSFNGWHGGFSTGPRYQIVALPAWILLLALLPESRWARNALLALGGIAFLNMFVVAAVSPAAPNSFHGSPLLFCYRHLALALIPDASAGLPPGAPLSLGSLHLFPVSPMRAWPPELWNPLERSWSAFNLGEKIFHLRAGASLLPFLAFSGGMVAWMTRVARR